MIIIMKSMFLVGALLGASFTLQSANWPQWRGPASDGVAPSADRPPIKWSETENVKWKIEVPGKGHSTPIIWGDKIFLLTAVSAEVEEKPSPTENQGRGGRFGAGPAPSTEHHFLLICYDRKNGKELWRQVCRKEIPHEGHHQTNTFASGSPVTDGHHVWVHYGSRGIYCFTLEGEPVWSRDFGKMKTRNGFGEGTSPALGDGKLVVLWDTEAESWIAALDALTGKELWRQVRDEPTTWSTPLIVEHDGRKQVVVNATNAVRSYDLRTGEIVWQCAGQTVNAIPSPVTDGEMVYVMSGYRGNAAYGIRLGGKGDLQGSESVRWTLNRGTPYVPSPLLHDGTLYFVQGNDAILSAVDSKTGEVYYQQERIPGIRGVYASPLAAGGHIYLAGRDGATAVLKPGKKLEVVATNLLPDPIDASPVVLGGELYLRTHRELYCLAE